jgi:hypothetical protein
MDSEEIRGVVPEVRIPGAMGINTFELYVSTKRLVFIQTSKGYQALGGAMFGAVGAAVSGLASEKGKTSNLGQQVQNIDLDTLLKSKKGNKEFLLNDITQLRLKKGMGSHRISIFVMKKNKNKIIFDGFLVPPQDYLKYYKKEGLKTKQISLQYVKETESVLNTVLSDRINSNY